MFLVNNTGIDPFLGKVTGHPSLYKVRSPSLYTNPMHSARSIIEHTAPQNARHAGPQVRCDDRLLGLSCVLTPSSSVTCPSLSETQAAQSHPSLQSMLRGQSPRTQATEAQQSIYISSGSVTDIKRWQMEYTQSKSGLLSVYGLSFFSGPQKPPL